MYFSKDQMIKFAQDAINSQVPVEQVEDHFVIWETNSRPTLDHEDPWGDFFGLDEDDDDFDDDLDEELEY